MATPNKLDYLVNVVAAGNASEAEMDELLALILEDKDGRVAPRIEAILQDLNLPENELPARDMLFWKQVSQAVLQEVPGTFSQDRDVIKHIPFRRWWVAAALVLAIATAGYLWVKNHSFSEKEMIAQTREVQPGKQGAVLQLEDGTIFVLDSLNNGVIAAQGGSQVILHNGQLAYKNATNTAEKPVFNIIHTPKGRQFHLILSDGTAVWLNAGSSVRFQIPFTGHKRSVDISGEVYFDVTKNAAMPFHVNINNHTEIEVLGTQFNVNAYSDERSIKTTLVEGAVKILNGKQRQNLKPGQQAEVIQDSLPGEVSIRVHPNVSVESATAWKNGYFDFNGLKLREAMRQLERWYDIEVAYEAGVADVELYGQLSRTSTLQQMIDALKFSDIQLRMEGKKITIIK